jgi:mRNA-degrading endonuclease RelE of RelBE toxin-antitoxin system
MVRGIYAASRFPRTWKKLHPTQRDRVIEIILALPDLLKNPHRQSGFGFRRLHGTNFYEARLDLRWRLILRIEDAEIILFDVLNHDEVRRLAK